MTFFYDLNKKLADIAKKQDLNESVGSTSGFLEASTGDYSAKKARAGKDIGKPGKMFSKIAKSAGKAYGSKERGEKVAGAVLAKLRKGTKEAIDPSLEEAAGGPSIEKVLDAVAKIYQTQYDGGDEIWEADWMQDWAHALMQANPTDKELDFIIANGHMPKRLANVEFEVGDDFQFGEGNEFSGELAKAKAAGAKQFKVDGKTYPVKEASKPMTPKQKSFAKLAPPANKITFADKIAGAKKEVDEMLGDVAAEAIKSAVKKKEPRSKGTAFDPEVAKGMFSGDKGRTRTGHEVKDTGYSKRYTKPLADEPEADDEKSDAPKKKGRPAGTKRAIGAKGPTGRSKLMSKGAIKETDSEYDQEGKSAKCDIKTIVRHAQALHKILGDHDNLPEWVQSKLAKIEGMMTSVDDYMQNQNSETGEEKIAEKAVSKKQQKFMGMVHAAQKGEKPASGAVAKVAKEMPKKAAKDFAATKHKGLPEKVKAKKEESVEETSDAPKAKKSSGGFEFGKGIYESMNKKYTHLLNEGMNISVNMNTGADGQPTKNITVSADGDDAETLASLLKMAGVNQAHSDTCDACGKAPCGCEELDENSPDWPTNTETSDNAMQYSGGLNGPKSTGQTTVPVIASQLRRQVSMEESVELERNLFKLYQAYKAQ